MSDMQIQSTWTIGGRVFTTRPPTASTSLRFFALCTHVATLVKGTPRIAILLKVSGGMDSEDIPITLLLDECPAALDFLHEHRRDFIESVLASQGQTKLTPEDAEWLTDNIPIDEFWGVIRAFFDLSASTDGGKKTFGFIISLLKSFQRVATTTSEKPPTNLPPGLTALRGASGKPPPPSPSSGGKTQRDSSTPTQSPKSTRQSKRKTGR